MKKCTVCLEGKARRECLLKEGAKICSRCCAELRGDSCGECPHYADIVRYEMKRLKSKGTPPEGHFIAEINPKLEDAVYDALERGMGGRVDEAMQTVERLAGENPRNYIVHYGLGILHGVKDHHEKAIECFLRCLKIFPYFGEAHYNLAVSYGQLYRIADAVRSYRKAVKYSDPEEEYHAAAKAALKHAAQIIEKSNGVDLDTYLESSATFEQSFEHMERQRWEEALAGFQTCAGLIDNLPSTHGNMALCYANLGRKADALAAFDRALEIDPTYSVARENRKVAECMEEGTPLSDVDFATTNYAVEKMEQKKRRGLFRRRAGRE